MSKQAEGLFFHLHRIQQCLLAFSLHPSLLPSSAPASVSSPLLDSLPSVMPSSTMLVVCIIDYSLHFTTCIKTTCLMSNLGYENPLCAMLKHLLIQHSDQENIRCPVTSKLKMITNLFVFFMWIIAAADTWKKISLFVCIPA